MAIRFKEYMKLREEFLRNHPFCQFAKKTTMIGAVRCKSHSEDVHHRLGRGEFLCDVKTWMAVCRKHHQYIHDHPAESYANGWMIKRNTK